MKPIILIFVGHYLPGIKSGGILRSVENTVENLGDEFDFLIVTRNTDVGDLTPYPNIKPGVWLKVGKAKVLYMDKTLSSYKNILSIMSRTKYHAIHLNSFFDSICIKVLLARKFNTNLNASIILSPRGEFARASFKIRLYKKNVYVFISKLFKLFHGVVWHVSTRHEKKDLDSVMKISNGEIYIAEDLPIKPLGNQFICFHRKCDDILKVVFLSRISPEKNLKYALNVLKRTKCQIVFDIYGFIDDKSYWQECLIIINKIQADNLLLSISYLGELYPDEVVKTFSKYDIFLFPSGGENYGHVIAESLIAGTPVLISNKTPWSGLVNDKVGWAFDLNYENKFIEILEKVAKISIEERSSMRIDIVDYMNTLLSNSDSLKDNRQLFNLNISEL